MKILRCCVFSIFNIFALNASLCVNDYIIYAHEIKPTENIFFFIIFALNASLCVNDYII